MNYFKHHLGDYDSATAHLTWDEDMAYTRLMRVYYRDEKPIPVDPAAACRLVRAQSKVQRDAVQTVLKEFFTRQVDGWHNKRCDAELAEARHFIDRQKGAAAKRWHKNGNATQMPPHDGGNASTDDMAIPARPRPIPNPITHNPQPTPSQPSPAGRTGERGGGILPFKTADDLEAEEIAAATREGRHANI